MRESQYLALFHMADFSFSIHHVGSREEFALMSPNPQAPASPKDCYKSSVIPICRSTDIPEKKSSAEAWQGLRIPVPAGCNFLLPYHPPTAQ